MISTFKQSIFFIIHFLLLIFHANVKPGLSEAVTSASTRRRVVVFDIDNTLCRSYYLCAGDEKIIRKCYPECPIIAWNEKNPWTGVTERHSQVFLPHLNILFDYLLEQGVRIVFFSSAPKERNLALIPALLTSFWGGEKFEALKAKGQFDIFSAEHLRQASFPGEINSVKDLKVVIRDGETLLDAILVEDSEYVAHDQKEFLNIITLLFWSIKDKNEMKRIEKIRKYRFREENVKSSNFPLNSVYYMLGVFKTYFGNEKYNVLPLRECLGQLLPKESYYIDFFKTHSFAEEMINLGLSEVQKLVPNATYY